MRVASLALTFLILFALTTAIAVGAVTHSGMSTTLSGIL